jgi:hypothetical protein
MQLALNVLRTYSVALMLRRQPCAATAARPGVDRIAAALADTPEEDTKRKTAIRREMPVRHVNMFVVAVEVWWRQKFGVETNLDIPRTALETTRRAD